MQLIKWHLQTIRMGQQYNVRARQAWLPLFNPVQSMR